MKIAAIDVGSNSVRLAVIADGTTLFKRHLSTRLAENISVTGLLSPEAIERTALAIREFSLEAQTQNVARTYAFATAAVRSAQNKTQFINRVKELCGLEVDVISGEEEAKLGILGALGNKDGGIIDVGGASSEVAVQKDGVCLYSHSANVGTVRLHDIAGRDLNKLTEAASQRVSEYGSFNASGFDMYAIGGTATTLAAIKHNLHVYDPKITDGTVLYAEEIYKMSKYLIEAPIEEVMKVRGMEPRRADIIGGGCLLNYLIMKHFGIEKVIVSESDNMEGYIILKEGSL